MRIAVSTAAAIVLWTGSAWAWPYEQYRTPDDFSGYQVAAEARLKAGTAELLTDKRITAANRDMVRALLVGEEISDQSLQHAFDRDDPRWAVVRYTPDGGAAPEYVVLDHALATIAADDPNGDGVPELRVSIDYLEGYRGKLTLFMEPTMTGIRAVEYVDDPGGYKIQIELMEAAKAWFREENKSGVRLFRMVDSRFPERTDLMTIRWNGKAWMRSTRTLPGGAVKGPDAFPAADHFP